MDFQAFWAEVWARCGPAHMGFEQCEAARDVYEKAKARIEAAERERWAKQGEPVAWYDGSKFYGSQEAASMDCADMAALKPLYAANARPNDLAKLALPEKD